MSAVHKVGAQPGDLSFELHLYHMMKRIRLFEEKVAELIENRTALTPCHLYIGQEAVATGVCAALGQKDVIWGNHRSHGHFLAKGGEIKSLMAEILCRDTGVCRGRGGSMHVISRDHGISGTVPIVAATIPLAVGAGLAFKLKKEPHVSVAFFGDGATEEGQFHESMNLAALYKLPVVFVCENNQYASHMSMKERRPDTNLYEMGLFYRMNSEQTDGNDVNIVLKAMQKAIHIARSGQGPSFLEFSTYRWRGHVGPRWDMDVGVKRKDELKDWLDKDPILRQHNRLLEKGVSEMELTRIGEEVKRELDDVVQFGLDSVFPPANEVQAHVFS